METSKHISLRVSKRMHNRLVDAAERDHRSVNGQIEWYIEQGFAADAERLKDRIATALKTAGFIAYDRAASGQHPMFLVSEGVGAIVSLAWEAPEDERALMLVKYEARLRESGLPVENRGKCLYVPETTEQKP